MSSAVNVPKNKSQWRKEDYETALVEKTSLDAQTLRTLTVERLKYIHNSMKPKVVRTLPSNWKRFSKAALMELYVEKIQPKDKEYLRMTKDHLIVELEMFVAEEEIESPGGKTMAPLVPQCPECAVAMVERRNRVDGGKFYGCAMFPRCRVTMPMTYHGQPTAVIQNMQPPKHGYKGVFQDGGEEMNGDVVKRAIRTPVPSLSEWDKVSQGSSMISPADSPVASVPVTAEEKALIKELRQSQQPEKKK